MGASFYMAANQAMELISSQTLAAPAASFTAVAIPSLKYKAIVMFAAIKHATGDANIKMLFNGDAGNNYTGQYVLGATAAVTAATSSPSYAYAGSFTNTVSTACEWSFCPSTSIQKAWRGSCARSVYSYALGGIWNNTNPITTVQILASAGNIDAGSELHIYGVK